MDDEKLQEAKNYAFRLLSYRERSKYEIKSRLLKKGYNREIAHRVIDDLSRLDYLNDERFARKWVKDRINHKPRGSNLLKYELKDKGINRHTIDQVLSELLHEELEKKMAARLAQKWLKINKDKNNYYLKLKRYLANKGFPTYIINDVVSYNEINDN